MAQLIALYNKPTDVAAFDAHYAGTHIPLAKKIPGLRRCQISTGAIDTPAGAAAYHLVAILDFDSKQAVLDGLASPEGKATAGDLANFAQAGVDLLIFDSKGV
ncbi:MAG: EthD family reductase [Rudaea sp.]|uniref:EthD family reductase n=1 Tax=Rudaea sp. TaxID=2136325 RepID=UPI0039E6E373